MIGNGQPFDNNASSEFAESCFVIMPSGRQKEYLHAEKESDHVFNQIIAPAVERVFGKNKVRRELNNAEPGAVKPKIITSLRDYGYAIADITGGNANVFFELGIRQSLRSKVTIIMSQKTSTIPFDISDHRVLYYHPLDVDESKKNLEDVLRKCQEGTYGDDSIVQDVLGKYELRFTDHARDVMPWDFYFKAIETLASSLLEHKDTYFPHAVIGISNGGMIVADFLHRSKVFVQNNCTCICPFVSLWADRDHTGNYFTCESNKAILDGLIRDIKSSGRAVKGQDGRMRISLLLVDDNVSNGDTAKQANIFIKNQGFFRDEELQIDVHFAPLFWNRPDALGKIKDMILWARQPFNFSDEEIMREHLVLQYRYFPYEKQIGH